MRLTSYTDYSLRTMMYLAVKPERLATIADISTAYGISDNHLMKIVHQLGQAGFVDTVRGRRGGLRLARPADQINLGAIVRTMEPDMEIAPCFVPENSCVIAPCCGLQHVLREALDAFLAVLDRYTLADLVRSPRQLAGLLDIAAIGGTPADPRLHSGNA
jgi:Rrf2 family nitric oxide-sensitive transcriptional repressor